VNANPDPALKMKAYPVPDPGNTLKVSLLFTRFTPKYKISVFWLRVSLHLSTF
jgi:hypothetical protein